MGIKTLKTTQKIYDDAARANRIGRTYPGHDGIRSPPLGLLLMLLELRVIQKYHRR